MNIESGFQETIHLPVLDLSRHCQKGLLDITCCFCTRFKKWDANFVSECLQNYVGYQFGTPVRYQFRTPVRLVQNTQIPYLPEQKYVAVNLHNNGYASRF